MKNFLKNGLKLFLAFTIIFTNCISFAFAEDTNEEEYTAPKIRMGGDGNVVLKSGKETTVEVPIINTAQGYAHNLLIQAKAEKDAPFTMKFLNNSNRKNIIERVGSTKAIISFDVDKNAVSGTYPVTLEFSYTGSNKTSYNNSDTLYVKIDNENGEPNVVLNNFSSSKNTVLMGQEFSINAILENTTIMDVKNLSLQVLGLDENNMTLVGDTNTIYIEKFQGTTKKPLTFNFATTNKTKEGSNKLTFKITYVDTSGKEYTREFQYYVTVSKNGNTANQQLDLKITGITAPKNTLGVNQSGTFTLKIKNAGKSEAKNIKITAKIPEGIVPTSSNIVVLPSILAGEEKTVSFSVAPTSSAKTQAYSVGFAVEYNTGETTEDGAETAGFEQYAGVNVNNPDADKDDEEDKDKKTSVPKIIISKYESTPMIVEAGKPFDLAMTFKNTHSEKVVKNIKLYLTIEDKTEEKGNVFAPNNSSTTYYIDNIPPNGEVHHIFNLFTVPDAKPRSYTINVNFEYEDEKANEYKSTELVGVNVKQPSKLETNNITIPTTGFVGEPIYTNFQVYNTGKVTLSNLKVEFEGEGFDTTTATSFIGNLQSGSTEYYDGNFIPLEAGEKTVTLRISYEDTDGQIIERKEEYTIDIQEQEVVDSFNEFDEQNMPAQAGGISKKKILAIIVSICIVIALAIILFLYFKKRAKLKKEFDFNE